MKVVAFFLGVLIYNTAIAEIYECGFYRDSKLAGGMRIDSSKHVKHTWWFLNSHYEGHCGAPKTQPTEFWCWLDDQHEDGTTTEHARVVFRIGYPVVRVSSSHYYGKYKVCAIECKLTSGDVSNEMSETVAIVP